MRTTGVRLVLANCADPAREVDFNERYDAYAKALTEPGFLVTAGRFHDPDAAASGRPAYAAVYDIELDDPGEAWPLTTEHSSKVAGPLAGLLDVTLRATYARIVPRESQQPVAANEAVTLVLSDPRPGIARDEVEDWFRGSGEDGYTLVEGSPDPPLFLELRTGADAAEARAGLLQERLSGRYHQLSTVRRTP